MSILKFVNGRNKSAAALRKAVEYVLDSEKSMINGFFCNGVRDNHPAEDMELLQNILGKDKGRRYIHYVISFDNDIDEDRAIEVSKAIASFFEEEYQFIGNLHGNTNNIHAHIIMNSVNFKTGKKFSQSKKEMLYFRDCINQFLIRSGLTPIGKKQFIDDWMKAIDVWESDDLEMDEEYYDQNDESLNGFFGPIDEEEAENIYVAEKYDEVIKQTVSYFRGANNSLPNDITVGEANEIFYQWDEFENKVYE